MPFALELVLSVKKSHLVDGCISIWPRLRQTVAGKLLMMIRYVELHKVMGIFLDYFEKISHLTLEK